MLVVLDLDEDDFEDGCTLSQAIRTLYSELSLSAFSFIVLIILFPL